MRGEDDLFISAVPVELGAARDRGIAHICRQSGQIFAEASTRLAPAVIGNREGDSGWVLHRVKSVRTNSTEKCSRHPLRLQRWFVESLPYALCRL
jgi:hypothetical protein